MERTEVKIESTIQINQSSSIVSLGSCFAENIGGLMVVEDILVNPHGILFNPYSLERAIESALTSTIRVDHFGVHKDVHFHYDYHSKMNGKSREEVEEKIVTANKSLCEMLRSANFIFLTFGTAWAWQLIETKSVIANCHKVSQSSFAKQLLGLDYQNEIWNNCVTHLLELNPQLQFVLSVSPVRHTRNGMHEDKLSKSTLLLLCDELVKNFESAHYFPAYEIIIDELRDYSHFKGDLIHPSDEAIESVYERFKVFSGI